MNSHPQDGEGDVVPEGIPVPGVEEPNVVPVNIPPVDWPGIVEDVTNDAQHERGNGGNWHDTEDDVGDGLLIGVVKQDQFDPGRGASRATLIKKYRQKVAANNRRRRARRSMLPLLDGLGGGLSGEYVALNHEYQKTIALAGISTYEDPKVGPDVRKAVVLTIAGVLQETIAGCLGMSRGNYVATQMSDYRGRVATQLLPAFQQYFEGEMRRKAIGGCVRLDSLYYYCAEADLGEGEPIDVVEFLEHDDAIDVAFKRVPQDVDRILELIAADVNMPMFVHDVVVNRLEAISEIASNHSGVIPARDELSKAEFVIAVQAVSLVQGRFPYFFNIPSLASFASWVGIDVTDD
jgi:hypothetical protein